MAVVKLISISAEKTQSSINPTVSQDLAKGIIVTSPQAYATIKSPLTITGKAKGAWFFEGVFGVKLRYGGSRYVASGQVRAIGNWMTSDYVNFEAVLEFDRPIFITENVNNNYGELVLNNANPSDLPENALEFSIPVIF